MMAVSIDTLRRRQVPIAGRLVGVDALRGLALVLMLVDHALAASGVADGWERTTVTRFSLPLFMVVAGALLRSHRPRVGRYVQVLACGLAVAGIRAAELPMLGLADVLLVFALVAPAVAPLLARWAPLVVMAGWVQATWWPVMAGEGYEPGTLAMWLGVGALVSLVDLERAGRWCRALAPIGRRPLTWYVGHHLVLAVMLGGG